MYTLSIVNARRVRLLTRIFFRGFRYCTSANMSSEVRLRLVPRKCLFNEPIRTTIEGLAPRQSIELTARLTDDKGITFKSSGTYQADPKGKINLDNHPSLGGSYSGVEPMGLFWSMRPETLHMKLWKRDVLTPCLVDIEVLDGEEHVLARETNERGFMVEGLQRISLKEGRIRGILFLPPGQGPFPGIVHMHTLGGGLSEVSGSLLANQGFVVLSLGYYGYEDLSKKITKFDLEYFEEAIMFMRTLPKVKGPGVGILSISKSGDLALSMASFLTGVSATVCVNSCSANTMWPLHYRGMVIPPLVGDQNKKRATESGVFDISDCLLDPMAPENQESLIPIERANCKFLFAVSGDDRNWKSCHYAEHMMKRLKDHGKVDSEMVVYPKAGHFLEVPYMPHCATGVHAAMGFAVVQFGGDPCAHAHAQVALWNRIPAFFREHLEGNMYRKAHL